MLFSSFTFLFWFLPLSLLLYFLLPPLLVRITGKTSSAFLLSIRNGVLLAVSLLFYGWGEPLYVFLMIVTVAVNFLLGLWLSKTNRKRTVLWIAICFDVSLLFYFKYAAFFLSLFGISVDLPQMPIGISFYTFQALSYVADVYFGTVPAERSILRFGTYVSLFPQLVAGPIVRYDEVAAELKNRKSCISHAAYGIRRFIAGLAKKTLIANSAGALFNTFVSKEMGNLSLLGAWLALLCFAIQIYFDFSGYSDMAVGLGAVFGFHFPENFNYPYTAISFTDFWRRWHITLSSFFKSYVYIPLGGSRHGVFRTVLSLFAVWSLTGLWHGAAWNFLLWGLYYFFFLTLEKFLLRPYLEKLPIGIRRFLTLLGVLLGWLIFAFDGSTAHLTFPALGRFLCTLVGGTFTLETDLYDVVRHVPFLLIATLGATPLPRKWYQKATEKLSFLGVVLPLLGFVLSLAALADAAYNPFLYFRF